MTHVPLGDGGISPMCTVWDSQSFISLVENKGGEVNLCHVLNLGHSLIHVPNGGWRDEEDLCHVLSGNTHQYMPPVGDGEEEEDLCNVRSRGHSLIHVPMWGWGRRRGSVPCA